MLTPQPIQGKFLKPKPWEEIDPDDEEEDEESAIN